MRNLRVAGGWRPRAQKATPTTTTQSPGRAAGRSRRGTVHRSGRPGAEKRGGRGTTRPLRDPPAAEEKSSEKATAPSEPEASRVPQVAKISFRKRKLEKPPEGGAEEDKADSGEDDGNEEVEDVREKPAQCDKEEEEAEEKEKAEKEKKAEDKEKEEAKPKEKAVVKKPRKTNPYGDWEQIQEEIDPYENVDLQLPQVEGVCTAPAPCELPPEPKVKFRERTITSLGGEGARRGRSSGRGRRKTGSPGAFGSGRKMTEDKHGLSDSGSERSATLS
ncbi:hypothetical protein ANANG_G00272260 [Anguilla anguilla]|uniref:Uncharacterized protein n=1 Tax=Anguilla anguilla TaxID=7936 RepID=A0A9D3RJT3_ANGAN|nr:hypothetical protein ANANG_G00272260 [Anguilla anguilla]